MAAIHKRENKDKNPLTEIGRAKATTLFKKTFWNAIKSLYPFLTKFIIPKREEYCLEVQEFYDFFDRMSERQKGEEMRQKFRILRDFTCWGLEYDRAYLMFILDSLREIDFKKLDIDYTDEELKEYSHDLAYYFRGKKYEE